MGFTSRKIGKNAAYAIAEAFTEATLGGDVQAADDAVTTAKVAFDNQIMAALATCKARDKFMSLAEDVRTRLLDSVSHQSGWHHRTWIVFDVLDADQITVRKQARWAISTSTHTSARACWYVEDCPYTKKYLPEQEQERHSEPFDRSYEWAFLKQSILEMCVGPLLNDGDAYDWDVVKQMEDAVYSMREAYDMCDAEDEYYGLMRSYRSLRQTICNEIAGRSTKAVLKAWPDLTAFVHDHYGYVSGEAPQPKAKAKAKASGQRADIPTPLADVVQGVMQPAITLAAE